MRGALSASAWMVLNLVLLVIVLGVGVFAGAVLDALTQGQFGGLEPRPRPLGEYFSGVLFGWIAMVFLMLPLAVPYLIVVYALRRRFRPRELRWAAVLLAPLIALLLLPFMRFEITVRLVTLLYLGVLLPMAYGALLRLPPGGHASEVSPHGDA